MLVDRNEDGLITSQGTQEALASPNSELWRGAETTRGGQGPLKAVMP